MPVDHCNSCADRKIKSNWIFYSYKWLNEQKRSKANNIDIKLKIKQSAFKAAIIHRGIRSDEVYFFLIKVLIEIIKETHDEIIPVT